MGKPYTSSWTPCAVHEELFVAMAIIGWLKDIKIFWYLIQFLCLLEGFHLLVIAEPPRISDSCEKHYAATCAKVCLCEWSIVCLSSAYNTHSGPWRRASIFGFLWRYVTSVMLRCVGYVLQQCDECVMLQIFD